MMFLLALVYLIILVVWAIFSLRASEGSRWGGLTQLALFAIIGFVLFWNVLNR